MLLYCKNKHVFGKLNYQITTPRDQFQATSWLVSQVVGSKDRKAANMHDLNSERLTLSPEVLAIRIETTLHSCCNRLVSAMCSTISAKQCNTSCIHFRPERPMTAEFHWNISSKVFAHQFDGLVSPHAWCACGCGKSFAYLCPFGPYQLWHPCHHSIWRKDPSGDYSSSCSWLWCLDEHPPQLFWLGFGRVKPKESKIYLDLDPLSFVFVGRFWLWQIELPKRSSMTKFLSKASYLQSMNIFHALQESLGKASNTSW